jgi:hypothetical protein
MTNDEQAALERETLRDLLLMLDPSQSARGVEWAIREALIGHWMPLVERFDLPHRFRRVLPDELFPQLFAYLDTAGIPPETEDAIRMEQHAKIAASLVWPW